MKRTRGVASGAPDPGVAGQRNQLGFPRLPRVLASGWSRHGHACGQRAGGRPEAANAVSDRGGTGRRAGLRILCLRAWGFDSLRSHGRRLAGVERRTQTSRMAVAIRLVLHSDTDCGGLASTFKIRIAMTSRNGHGGCRWWESMRSRASGFSRANPQGLAPNGLRSVAFADFATPAPERQRTLATRRPRRRRSDRCRPQPHDSPHSRLARNRSGGGWTTTAPPRHDGAVPVAAALPVLPPSAAPGHPRPIIGPAGGIPPDHPVLPPPPAAGYLGHEPSTPYAV
jgi:hypothetical protein